MNWHSKTLPSVFEAIQSSEKGLTDAGAAQRRLHSGLNELVEKKRKSGFQLFMRQFKDVMILALLVASLISGFIGELTDTVIILIIVILNAVIGFVQESRAEKAVQMLKKMSAVQAMVLRDGYNRKLPAAELVPGDIVFLEAGNAVPADVRLIAAHAFAVDESSLTGESVPVSKVCRDVVEPNVHLGDRVNMAYKGTMVTSGRAEALVVATGMATEIGKIALLLQEKEMATPLQKRMTDFGKRLSVIILGICAILFGIGLLRGEDPVNMLLLSISLAVAAIPEALPALITIALALGAKRLVRKNALIRKLTAVETLGSVAYICSDKTGTLTMNRMKVVQQQEPAGSEHMQGVSMLYLNMILNHDVRINADGKWTGDPTELALVEQGIERWGSRRVQEIQASFQRVAELPFDAERKGMSTLYRYEGRYLMFSKGAPEYIAGTLSNGHRTEEYFNQQQRWAEQGLRVLAFAYRELDHIPEPFTVQTAEMELQWAGLAGLMDPPREEVKAAIAECKGAGIKTVMITGDHPATATAIATQVGILDKNGIVLSGAEMETLPKVEFMEMVEKISVYARVTPEQKITIVKALQEKGHSVSMTGDGVNDAPSLRAADIGVAMGISGTDVSKEASDMILLDDNFTTIVKAVREGRRIYDNIRKFVKYIMTCNGAEIWTIFLAPLVGLPIPLLPIHILWINLVTDGLPGLALAGEKAEEDIMRKPPRKSNESLFAGGISYHMIWVGLLMAGVTLGVQQWAIQQQHVHWQTMVFTVLSLSQLGHVIAIRSEKTFLFRQGFFSNFTLALTVLLTIVLQLGIIYLPFANTVFKTQPLDALELLICFGASALVFHAVEGEKWMKRRFFSGVPTGGLPKNSF